MTTFIHAQSTNGTNPALNLIPHDNTSSRYVHIDTQKVEEVFLDHGFALDARSYAIPRKESRRGFQKHMSIFTRSDLKLGQDAMQLLWTNGHDGTTSAALDFGVFREICANGLVVGSSAGGFKIRHVGDVQSKLDEAIKYMLDRMPLVAAEVEAMQHRSLDNEEIRTLTRQAVVARTGKTPEYTYDVRAKRHGDMGSGLWEVFNRIQERAIGGGLQYLDKDKKFHQTRKITAVDRTIKLNKELWNAAQLLVA